MVEKRPFLDFLTHAVLLAGVAVIAFPAYVTFVASTITAEEVLAAPMTLVPGPHLLENYKEAWLHGAGNSAAVTTIRMLRCFWCRSSSKDATAVADS